MISVVVAVYNGEKTIAQTLNAILQQNFSGQMEVIVVDDGSTDRTPEILKTFSKVKPKISTEDQSFESLSFPNALVGNPQQVHLGTGPDEAMIGPPIETFGGDNFGISNRVVEIKCLRQPNQGPAAARNKGAELAQGEIIFFTDSDCVPAPDWIKTNIVHYFDPSVAVVAGSYDILNNESRLARCIHAEIIFRHHVLMPLYPKVFGSYNFSIRKKIFHEVGGFNTAYRYPSGEDNDLSYKVIKAGYKIYFARDSRVAHYHPTKLSKYLAEQYRHGFWRVKMYADHPSLSRGDDYTFWKDMVEIPIAGLLMLSPLVIFFESLFAIVMLFHILFYLVELYYGFIMTRRLPEGFFLSWVMWLRSFFRALGFSSGIFDLFRQKFFKKNK